jgi:hypothetical protein
MVRPNTPSIIVWDDQFTATDPDGSYRALLLVARPHADDWMLDLQDSHPVCGLLDNDMGPDHQRGWDVVGQIRKRYPLLTLVCVSSNTAACLFMARTGVPCLPKVSVLAFVERLDELLARGDGGAETQLPVPDYRAVVHEALGSFS